MSKLFVGELVAEDKMMVQMIYNLEAEENKDLDLTKGVVVDEEAVPPEPKIGVWHVWYVNPTTKEQWFEEVPRPLTPEEEAAQKMEAMQATIDSLVLDALNGGATNV